MESSPRRPVQAGNSSLGADGAAAELNSQALGRACGTDRQAVLPGDTAVRAAPAPELLPLLPFQLPRPPPLLCSAPSTPCGGHGVLQRGLNVPLAGPHGALPLGARRRPGRPEAEKGRS